MWEGYLVYDGTEIANVARTAAYASDVTAFRPVQKAGDLGAVLEETYTDPATDGAPWYDADVPESADFYGFYPLDVSGAHSSSRASTVIELTDHGAIPGRLRHGSRTMVFDGVVLAKTEEALDYGLHWLRRALVGAACSDLLADEQGLGVEVSYLSVRPTLAGQAPTEVRDRLTRVLPRSVVNVGPTVSRKREFTGCDGWVALLQFTLVSGSPVEIGVARPVLQGLFDAAVPDPWAPGVSGGAVGVEEVYTEVDCGLDRWAPIFDPLNPAMMDPPSVPQIPHASWDPLTTWDRTVVTIPETLFPTWTDMTPVLTLTTGEAEVRSIRVRFYEDPTGDTLPDDAPCDFVGDLVVSYLPALSSIVVDASRREVYVYTSSGFQRRADSLIFQTNSAPFDYPALRCGISYRMAVDYPPASTPPTLDLSLVPRIV